MESFLLNDVGSMIDNKAIERIISLMTVQLCLLILSMEKKGMENEVFASLEKTAEELVQASEEFVQVAQRNITLVAQKLHLQLESQSHQEELVTTAQQILVDTMKPELQCLVARYRRLLELRSSGA
ncbi:hypothetical protein JEQ12_013909 [Ovis aries]|uniref:Uncharacterized protein n=1 Tax=Ovis aries TaxID=9940 RepID=A0A836A9J5_SHEEP|nr:hypothetical protein JEQ12_013909 [Ovis aries]